MNPYTNYGYNYYSNYYTALGKRLEEYIQDELQDSAYYKELAKLAPTEFAKEILLDFSEDEGMHAKNHQKIYYMITGRYYQPKPLKPINIEDYDRALKMRVLAESEDYKKYGEEYLMAPTKLLQDHFFNTRTVEMQHAVRISILFEEEVEEDE